MGKLATVVVLTKKLSTYRGGGSSRGGSVKTYRVMTLEKATDKARKTLNEKTGEETFMGFCSWAKKLYKLNGEKVFSTNIEPHPYFEEGNGETDLLAFSLSDLKNTLGINNKTFSDREIYEMIRGGAKLVYFIEVGNIDKNKNYMLTFD